MLQEILEQIVDIDLVLNFKCTECLLKKHLGNQTCSTCEDLLKMGSPKLSLNLPSKDNQMEHTAAAADAESALKEKHRIYAEQVFLFHIRRLIFVDLIAVPGHCCIMTVSGGL